jgi:hypothetical protein
MPFVIIFLKSKIIIAKKKINAHINIYMWPVHRKKNKIFLKY